MPGFEIFGDEEKNEVKDVLDTGVLFRYGFDAKRNGNWKAKQFESEFSKFTSANHTLLLSSGTTALTTVIAASGIGYGDEVIVPPFTFVATIESILSVGAVPIFAEIDDTLCIDPNNIEKLITNRTKAIIVVHMCGAMARIDSIIKITDKYNLLLIEDACQATGAFYNGKSVGTFGIAGCFSFDSVKTITCGEGGGIITNDKQLYQKCDAYHDHGHDHIGNDRGAENHNLIGMNFRISELNAAVGLAQLRKINKILEIQKNNANQIKTLLAKYTDIKLRTILSDESDTATFINFLLPNEKIARIVAKDLNTNGADDTFYWYDNNWHYIKHWDHIKNLNYPMDIAQKHLNNLPDYNNLKLTQSDDIISRTISMQVKLSWSQADIDKRIATIDQVLQSHNLK